MVRNRFTVRWLITPILYGESSSYTYKVIGHCFASSYPLHQTTPRVVLYSLNRIQIGAHTHSMRAIYCLQSYPPFVLFSHSHTSVFLSSGCSDIRLVIEQRPKSPVVFTVSQDNFNFKFHPAVASQIQ